MSLSPSALLLLLLVSLGCGHPQLPPLTPPAVHARRDPLPALPLSALAVPLRVSIGELEPILRQHIALPNVADHQQVSEPGQSPELHVRYQSELLTPVLREEGGQLHLTLPISYFGSLRVRVKTPFGWVWLSKGTDWGSADKRGRIDIQVATRLTISTGWELTSSSTLQGIRLSAPPIDKLCTSGMLRVCVPAELARDRVHRELERRVREAVQPALVQVDSQVRERVSLRRAAQELWQRLGQASRAFADGSQLALRPEQMALILPSVDGEELLAELRVWARPGGEPALEGATALPAPSSQAFEGNDVHLLLPLTTAALSQGLTVSLTGAPALSKKVRVVELVVLGPAQEPQRWLLAMTFDVDGQRETLYAGTQLSAEHDSIRLHEPKLLASSEPRLAALDVPPEALRALLITHARAQLTAYLQLRMDALRSMLAESVSPWPSAPLEGARAALVSVHAADRQLLLVVRAR